MRSFNLPPEIDDSKLPLNVEPANESLQFGRLGGSVLPSVGRLLCLGGEDGSAGLRRSLEGN